MSEHLVWSVGNRNPPITENIVDGDGVAVDLSASTVAFKMRAVGSSTLKTSAAATIVGSPTLGNVSYSWAALDVDTAGEYLIWWEVTTAAKTQDVMEAVIEFRAHAPGEDAYLELEEAKSTLELGTGHADSDLASALVSASRIVDELTGTRFFTTAIDEVRYFTPLSVHSLDTYDFTALTELATASNGSTYTAWGATAYKKLPLNADLDGQPWQSIHRSATAGLSFPVGVTGGARLTGKFGWVEPPTNVREATGIIATKIVKRKRDAPMGIITAFDGTAIRMSQFDPQVEELLKPYVRRRMIA